MANMVISILDHSRQNKPGCNQQSSNEKRKPAKDFHGQKFTIENTLPLEAPVLNYSDQ